MQTIGLPMSNANGMCLTLRHETAMKSKELKLSTRNDMTSLKLSL